MHAKPESVRARGKRARLPNRRPASALRDGRCGVVTRHAPAAWKAGVVQRYPIFPGDCFPENRPGASEADPNSVGAVFMRLTHIHSEPTIKRAFTLVELLVVVLIISILAAIAMFAMVNATESGRQARTRSQIKRIDELLAPMWEAYITRRVPVTIPAGTSPQVAAQIRLDGLRELMRLELPDQKADVTTGPQTIPNAPTPLQRPAVSQAYQAVASGMNADNQSAKCLYLILAHIQDVDGSALDYFHETEIGVDEDDGMRMILDAWGTPIRFLRWAPAFVSPTVNSALQNGDHTKGADQFDPLNVRADTDGSGDGVYETFFLYPLVISAGMDKEFGLDFDTARSPINDPYATALGAVTDADQALDNVHNHLLEISNR